jgi:hypothetical protein
MFGCNFSGPLPQLSRFGACGHAGRRRMWHEERRQVLDHISERSGFKRYIRHKGVPLRNPRGVVRKVGSQCVWKRTGDFRLATGEGRGDGAREFPVRKFDDRAHIS